MKVQDIHIAMSPLTERIYAGTLGKRDPMLWGQKVDRTSEFIAALMEWSPVGEVRSFVRSDGKTFEVEVREAFK